MPTDAGVTAAPITVNDAAAAVPIVDAGPGTCARGVVLEGEKAPKRIDQAAVARLVKIKDDPAAAALDRTKATFELADLYRNAGHLDEAIAILGPIALSDPRLDVGEAAVERYLDALVRAREGCSAELERDLGAMRARYCPPARKDRFCSGLALIAFQLRSGRAIRLAETDRAAAGAAFESLFRDSCVGGGDRVLRCDEIAYNAAISYDGAGDPAKARAMLALMKDPKNGLTKSPLIPRLECLFTAKDAGACH